MNFSVCVLLYALHKDVPNEARCTAMDYKHWAAARMSCLVTKDDPLDTCEESHTSDGRSWVFTYRGNR